MSPKNKISFQYSKDGQLSEAVCEAIKHLLKATNPSLTLTQTLNSNGEHLLQWTHQDSESRDQETLSIDLEMGLGTSLQFASDENMSLQCDPTEVMSLSSQEGRSVEGRRSAPIEYVARVSSPEDWDRQTRLKVTLSVEASRPEPVSAWDSPTELAGLVTEDLSQWGQHRGTKQEGSEEGTSTVSQRSAEEMEGVNEGRKEGEVRELTEQMEKLNVTAKKEEEEKRKMRRKEDDDEEKRRSEEERKREEYDVQLEIQRLRREELYNEEERRKKMPMFDLLVTERDAMKSVRPEDINYASKQMKKKMHNTTIG